MKEKKPMAELRIVIHGEPVPQGRPKFSSKPFPHAYDPAPSRKYKEKVKVQALLDKPQELYAGALEVEVLIYKKTLKSFSKVKKKAAEAKLLRPTTKPDADNYAKGILDAMKGIIWEDDGQVVRLICEKFYSEDPRAEVTVRPLQTAQVELF